MSVTSVKSDAKNSTLEVGDAIENGVGTVAIISEISGPLVKCVTIYNAGFSSIGDMFNADLNMFNADLKYWSKYTGQVTLTFN